MIGSVGQGLDQVDQELPTRRPESVDRHPATAQEADLAREVRLLESRTRLEQRTQSAPRIAGQVAPVERELLPEGLDPRIEPRLDVRAGREVSDRQHAPEAFAERKIPRPSMGFSMRTSPTWGCESRFASAIIAGAAWSIPCSVRTRPSPVRPWKRNVGKPNQAPWTLTGIHSFAWRCAGDGRFRNSRK
ncbi:MAG: hypothetical protein M9894_16865 [Planctomycetes bacterium]|nr:hypothetical protein [Planctomycetota bacterium]